jgi:acyl carrier protein
MSVGVRDLDHARKLTRRQVFRTAMRCHGRSTAGSVTGDEGVGERMSEALAEQIRKLVAEQLGVDRNQVTPQASILDDLGADSLDVVELVMAIEESFDIEIPDEAIETMRTIGDVETYVARNAA